jgi:cytochrome c oxidase assembly protein subunit 15
MYKKLNYLSIFFIFMLFVLGGLVRSTGSGMGCPDWPKCFGEYIPPTSEADLPSNYEKYFQEQRLQKTERFAKLLTVLGMEEKAKAILNSNQIIETHQFNVVKAYVEYVNRLWGALTGIIVFVTFILSFSYLKSNPSVFVYTLLGYIAVFVNALLGAVVVNTNLIGGIVTVHFLAAFAAISFFMIARFKLIDIKYNLTPTLKSKTIALSLLALIIVQTIAGTQVREMYENTQLSGALSMDQISGLGLPFVLHRLLALISIAIAFFQWFIFKKIFHTEHLFVRLNLYLFVLTISQLIIGSILILTELQSFSKLFHISIAAGVFTLQLYICGLLIKSSKNA